MIDSWLEVCELRELKFQIEAQIRLKKFRLLLHQIVHPQAQVLIASSTSPPQANSNSTLSLSCENFQKEFAAFFSYYLQLVQALYSTTHRLPVHNIANGPQAMTDLVKELQQSLTLLTSISQMQTRNQDLAHVSAASKKLS